MHRPFRLAARPVRARGTRRACDDRRTVRPTPFAVTEVGVSLDTDMSCRPCTAPAGGMGEASGRTSGRPASIEVSPRSFFFQAEDGIRDLYVTGVQTCALPI